MALFCATVALGFTPTDFTPAFFWSPREIGVGRTAEHLHTVSAQDLEGAIDVITGLRKGTAHPLVTLGQKVAPEIQLVFLADGLHTEAVRQHGAGLKNLENLLQTSASSLSVPFTTRAADVPRIFDSATRLAASEAEKYLIQHASLYHNGVPDVVVVELKVEAAASEKEALVAFDALVGRLSHIVARATKGNYAGLVTGLQRIAAGDGQLSRGRLLQATQVETMPYLHMTPTLLTAYLVGLLLFLIFISGFCCLFSLQTPKKFDEPKLA